MPILLNLLRNPYAIGVLAVILVGGIQQWRIGSLKVRVSVAQAELSQQREAWSESSRAGEKAAREAVEAAVGRERERQAERQAEEREAAARLAEAAEQAAREAADWRRRYREALTEPGCRAWSGARVACPVL